MDRGRDNYKACQRQARGYWNLDAGLDEAGSGVLSDRVTVEN